LKGSRVWIAWHKDIAAGEEEDPENNDRVAYMAAQGMEGPEARNVSRV
jgi:cold shock CspA family protein